MTLAGMLIYGNCQAPLPPGQCPSSQQGARRRAEGRAEGRPPGESGQVEEERERGRR